MVAFKTLDTAQLLPDLRPINENALQELLDRSKMNWDVACEPLEIQGGGMTPFLGVVRQDNRTCFQAVSKTYNPIQNRDVAELALLIADATESKIEVAKTLDNGGIQYFTIKGREFQFNPDTAKRGDFISEKITIVNSHNGTKALGISFGHVVLSCTNGMTRFDRKGYISIRHTANMERKLKEAIGGLKRILGESSRMIETYKNLSQKTVGEKEVKHVLELMTKVNMDENADALSTRATNIIRSAYNSVQSEMSYKGVTAWGLLNGATHYSTKIASESDSKLKSKMFGTMARRDKSVWDFLTSL